MNNIINFFKKHKIKKKQFKKKTHLIGKLHLPESPAFLRRNIVKKDVFYKKYVTRNKCFRRKIDRRSPTLIVISQKKFNPRGSVFLKKTLNTFSVGSIIKFFKVKQAKFIRRSLKGVKIFLNFLKNIVEKFYLRKRTKYLIIGISGVDYNLVNLKKNIKNLVKFDGENMLLLLNLKISFTKKKDKKIKAIKKRLRKKIISNFIKNTV